VEGPPYKGKPKDLMQYRKSAMKDPTLEKKAISKKTKALECWTGKSIIRIGKMTERVAPPFFCQLRGRPSSARFIAVPSFKKIMRNEKRTKNSAKRGSRGDEPLKTRKKEVLSE